MAKIVYRQMPLGSYPQQILAPRQKLGCKSPRVGANFWCKSRWCTGGWLWMKYLHYLGLNSIMVLYYDYTITIRSEINVFAKNSRQCQSETYLIFTTILCRTNVSHWRGSRFTLTFRFTKCLEFPTVTQKNCIK